MAISICSTEGFTGCGTSATGSYSGSRVDIVCPLPIGVGTPTGAQIGVGTRGRNGACILGRDKNQEANAIVLTNFGIESELQSVRGRAGSYGYQGVRGRDAIAEVQRG